jgi:hypothetical protein
LGVRSILKGPRVTLFDGTTNYTVLIFGVHAHLEALCNILDDELLGLYVVMVFPLSVTSTLARVVLAGESRNLGTGRAELVNEVGRIRRRQRCMEAS